jgi:hypothetical protein
MEKWHDDFIFLSSCGINNAKSWASEDREQETGIRRQGSGDRDQETGDRGQRTGGRGQRSVVGDRRSEY